MQVLSQQTPSSRPWWRHGMVWMVIAGPVAVVIAGVITAVIAFRGADPVVFEPPRAAVSQPQAAEPFALQPALQGRNHAATGTVPGAR